LVKILSTRTRHQSTCNIYTQFWNAEQMSIVEGRVLDWMA